MSGTAGGINRFIALLRSLLVFLLLVGVIVGSFWISFELGKKVLGSASDTSVKGIPLKIPEVPPEIVGLQNKAATKPKGPAIDAPIEEKSIAKTNPVAVSTTIKKITKATQRKPYKLVKSYYKVQAGTFDNKESAENMAKTLKDSGIDNFIKKTITGWRVQVGAYKTRNKAEELQAILKQKGIHTSIIVE